MRTMLIAGVAVLFVKEVLGFLRFELHQPRLRFLPVFESILELLLFLIFEMLLPLELVPFLSGSLLQLPLEKCVIVRQSHIQVNVIS